MEFDETEFKDAENGTNESSTDPEKPQVKHFDFSGEWNEKWSWVLMPPRVKCCFITSIVILLVMLIIVVPVLVSLLVTVEFEDNGVLIAISGDIDRAVGPGRYFAGDLVTFPRFDRSIEYTEDSNDAVSVRVQDGQIVNLDLSFQYGILQENLVEIYKLHQSSFEDTLKNLARSILRDVAAQHSAEQFFTNRTNIEEEMRSRLVIEGNSRLILVTGFQIRNVVLPTQLDQRLVEIQMSIQDARAGREQLELDRINAEAESLKLKLSTERIKLITEYEQGTKVLQTIENQKKRKIEETTRQLVTQIEENGRRNVSLYNRETDIQEEEVELDISVETERTRRFVDKIQIESETNLTIYLQETDNIRLDYENQVAVINEQTRQNVTRIQSETAQRVEQFEADLERALAIAQREARQLIARVTEIAKNRTLSAQAEGFEGMPGSLYLAEIIANSTMPHVKFMDVELNNLVDATRPDQI